MFGHQLFIEKRGTLKKDKNKIYFSVRKMEDNVKKQQQQQNKINKK